MSNLYNTKNIEQLLNDIQSLQETEQKLFNSLELNAFLTTEQQKKIIDQISKISDMRLNLYKTLGGVNQFYQNILSNSQTVSNQQEQAIQVVENQLNESKKKLNYLKTEKNNKIRLIQINDYYGQKYSEHATLMKYIIYMLIPIIILCLLHYNLGLLPSFLFYILIVIIAIIGSIYIINKMVSIWNRDNMNYQAYDWNFNAKGTPSIKDGASSDSPWFSSNLNLGTCIGEVCCSPGTLYDTTINKCILTKN